MTNQTTVVLAQLGCGYWGPNLLRNFSSLPGARMKWVAEPLELRRRYVETNFPHIRTTSDWEAAIADPEVDAIVIATPASTHAALVKLALEAGKHVFVEKPLALTTHEADELVNLAATHRRVLLVGHTFLYNAAVRYMKQYVDQGKLGQVYYMYSQRLNLGQVRSDVNAWWNLAPHDVSILLFLMNGELPTTVMASGIDYIQRGIEDVVFATMTWGDRTIAHIHVSWLDPSKTRKFTVVGSEKMLVYDDISEDKIAIFDKGVDRVPRVGEQMHFDQIDYQLMHRVGDIWLPRINYQEPLREEASHFLDCVRSGHASITGPEHARDVVRVLEAAHESLVCGRMVWIARG